MKRVLTTTVDGTIVYAGDSLEDAIRAWDGATYLAPAVGGITVEELDAEGNMTRQGNILKVGANGVVYLNPSI